MLPASYQHKQWKFATNCGYGCFVDGNLNKGPDRCICCQEPWTNQDTVATLYEIQDFVAQKTDRINAGEEERQRQGYELQTAYSFSPLDGNRISGRVQVGDEQVGNIDLLLDYGQSSTVWRINLGWRRRQDGVGFYIDPITGYWKKSEQEAEKDPNEYKERIVPYVKDNRNILIMRWDGNLSPNTTTTLRHALKLGMTEIFQIEENELYVEPLPNRAECNAFLYYESVEGGAGVLTRLPAEKTLLAKIAKAALGMMHFELPKSFEDINVDTLVTQHQKDIRCRSGCYRCLFSYYNQPDQENIDRLDATTLSILLQLAKSEVTLSRQQPAVAPSPSVWQAAATAAGWVAPDSINHPLTDGIIADYYYTERQAAIFIGKNLTDDERSNLENKGVICVVFPADDDEQQSEQWQTVFQDPDNKRLFTK